jgi:hypothetical protein
MPLVRTFAFCSLRIVSRTAENWMLEEQPAFDFHGFQAVYFFPYPESVVILDDAIAL